MIIMIKTISASTQLMSQALRDRTTHCGCYEDPSKLPDFGIQKRFAAILLATTFTNRSGLEALGIICQPHWTYQRLIDFRVQRRFTGDTTISRFFFFIQAQTIGLGKTVTTSVPRTLR